MTYVESPGPNQIGHRSYYIHALMIADPPGVVGEQEGDGPLARSRVVNSQ